MPRQGNILFIIIDQLRADCVFGALGAHVDLPNIRGLAKNAVRFDRHYSVTNPCGPSRASILTGEYAMNHRSIRNGTPLAHDTPNLATELRGAGYDPLLFGYTDTSQDPRAWPEGHPALTTYEYPMAGFREVVEMRLEESHPWRAHLLARGYPAEDYAKVYIPKAPEGRAPRLGDPALYAARDSDTAFLTDGFLDHMKGLAARPWCAHLTYIRPHPPLVAPAPYHALVNPAALPLPARMGTAEDEQALHPFMAPAQAHVPISAMVDGFGELRPTDEAVQQLRATYLGLAAEVDHHIGRVLEFLKATDQYDQTLVVLTADHGEMLGDRHMWGKLSVFDAAYRTPLIIRVPGNAAQAGRQVDAITESIDITPTILDWAGLQPLNAMDGRSLLPLLAGGAPSGWRDHSYSEIDLSDPLTPTAFENQLGLGPAEGGVAILREERFTLVEFAADLPPILFDKAAEGEFANVADNPAHSADLARLTRKMLRHRMRQADQTLALTTITPDGPKTVERFRR